MENPGRDKPSMWTNVCFYYKAQGQQIEEKNKNIARSMLFYMTFPLFSNRCYDAPKNSPKFNKCIKKVENICQSHKIRALKVLRYSIFSLQKMMTSNPDLVIIYLMRDPRAVMWSRTKTFGYPRKEVRGKISVLCEEEL